MMTLLKPNSVQIADFLAAQKENTFSYTEVGCSNNDTPPRGYNLDHYRIRIGSGLKLFERAHIAIQHWDQFPKDWLEVHPRRAPISDGQAVCTLIRVLGVWFLNPCRIIYVIDDDQPVKRFGFAYGTLRGHAEQGEERFLITWHRADDSVWYDLKAFSRPAHMLAKIGYPYTRMLQKRFAHASQRLMCRLSPAN